MKLRDAVLKSEAHFKSEQYRNPSSTFLKRIKEPHILQIIFKQILMT